MTEMLASWRSFDEYMLCQNGHVRSMQNHIFDKDDSKYHLITAKVIPTQKDQTPEGDRMYSLWFILKPNESVYSAFCTCKGGADQGCRHLGATLFELDDFLSKERTSVTSASILESKANARNQAIAIYGDENGSFYWAEQ